MSSLGLVRGTVSLSEYQLEWKEAFAYAKAAIAAALGDMKCNIQHIGGTSIPGMVAKPILDIAVGLSSELEIDSSVALLLSLGYVDRGMFGRHGGVRLLQKLDASNSVIHHIHLMTIHNRNWNLCLRYRDMLCEHRALFEQSVALKLSMATRYPNDRVAYTESKNDFVDYVHSLIIGAD